MIVFPGRDPLCGNFGQNNTRGKMVERRKQANRCDFARGIADHLVTGVEPKTHSYDMLWQKTRGRRGSEQKKATP